MRNVRLFLPVFMAVTWLLLAAPGGLSESLIQEFQDPPPQARPWVYWVWTGKPTRAALTRDLEQMKEKGIAGCIVYDVQTGRGVNWWTSKVVRDGQDYRTVPTGDYRSAYYTPVPTGPLQSWTPQWLSLVCYAAGEAGRLGINFVVSDGLANTSGDISEKYGEQKLVWTVTSVQGGREFQGILPAGAGWTKFHRDIAVLAVPDQDGFAPGKVINLTKKTDAIGQLRWQAPAGDWKIFRFAQVPTGARNEWGYFNDSMSAEAMDKQWDVTMAPLLKEMTPAERRALKGIEDDSWEAGKIGWTKLFPEEFKKRRGYDLIPYLPILAGEPMGDADLRQRVLRDYRLTISDLIADYHYAHLNTLARENGLTFYSEAAGPNFDQADLLKTSSKVAMAMAEFWVPSAHRPTMDSRFLLRNAANANHIYGNDITMCESFTSLGPEWEQTPFTLKPVADQAFCDGLNKVCVHNFSQSPSLTAKPGYVYVAGTHYEPGITWWNETPAFNAYLARCSAMLEAGKFVADAIIYHGDNIGHGEQRKTILPTLGEGYDHDNCNSQVLLTRMGVRDGRIVLSDGMSYRVLVLADQQTMPFADLKKIEALIKAGATVVGRPPTGMSGMPLRRHEPQKFNELAERMWGGLDGSQVTEKQFGDGKLIWGQTARQVLQREGVPPDFAVSGVSDGGTIDWIHRRTEKADIYYVASRWEKPESVDCTFRVSGRQPELWDPVTGETRDATAFRQKDGCTSIPLQFGPCGSIFVVFTRPIPPDSTGSASSNYPAMNRVTMLTGPWRVNFDPKWGGPAETVFDHLTDWTNSADPGVKYYSGTAVYHKEFNWRGDLAKNQQLVLDLGEVDDLATVQLNGHDLGVIWSKPAQVDITRAIQPGKNELTVAVVNLWPNRLIRDESLPRAQRLTETNIHKFGPESPLLPSGLIGPVSLLTATSP